MPFRPLQTDASLPPRLILYHKQATSARLRFLCLPEGVLAFGALPAPLTLRENAHTAHTIRPMPSAWSTRICHELGLDYHALEADQGFFEELVHRDGTYPVLLARFTSMDPPFALAETLHGRFIEIMDCGRLSAIERELLRRAYIAIQG